MGFRLCPLLSDLADGGRGTCRIELLLLSKQDSVVATSRALLAVFRHINGMSFEVSKLL